MNGELALMAALAGVGGRWLRAGADEPAPDLLKDNSSFQYVASFTAEMLRSGPLRRQTTAATPDEWLRGLRTQRLTELSLVTDLALRGPLPAHVASAFANSGTWALLATGRAAPTAWVIKWEVGNRDAPDRRIWSVTASSLPGETVSAPHLEVAEARERLRAALGEIREFALQHDELSSWAEWFAKADALLEDPAPVAPYHQDILPADASLDRRQLSAAVVQAWVFGGIGSWNDGGLADPMAQREYERVGNQLYEALLGALPAATNGA